MELLMTLNPFAELFDTNGAVAYLNDNGKTIAKITLKKNYAHLGRLLNARCRVYLKRELDAFIAGEDYEPDLAYESAIFDQLMFTDDAAAYLGITPTYLSKKLMPSGKINYEKRGNTALFIQEYLDQYREEHPS